MPTQFPTSLMAHADFIWFLFIVCLFVIIILFRILSKKREQKDQEYETMISELKKEMNDKLEIISISLEKQDLRITSNEEEFSKKIDLISKELTETRHKLSNELQTGFSRLELMLSKNYVDYEVLKNYVDKKELKLEIIQLETKLNKRCQGILDKEKSSC